MDLGELKVRISADIANLASGLQKAQAQIQAAGGKMQAAGDGMKNVGTKMSFAATAPIALMAKVGITELASIEKANAQTAASLARIGSKSLVSVSGVQKLAGALQAKSGIDDQVIQSGANLLLTLGAIDTKTAQGKKTFETATASMVDFAEATGTDAASAGKLYAKSLAAAANGTLLLPRGVKLSATETAKLTKVLESGASAGEKQAAMADALGRKFKGASQLTGTEKWGVLTDQLAGLAASVMETLMPSIEAVVGKLGDWADKFDQLSPGTKKIVGIIALVVGVMGPLLVVIGAIVTAIGVLIPVVAAITLPMLAIAAAIATAIAAGILLYKHWDEVKAKLADAWNKIKTAASAVWTAIKNGVVTAWTAIRDTVVRWADAIVTNAKARINLLVSAVTGIWTLIRTGVSAAWGFIRDAVTSAANAVVTAAKNKLDDIISKVTGVWTTIRTGVSSAWGFIKDAVETAAGNVVTAAKNKLDDLVTKLKDIGQRAGSALAGAIKSAINSVISLWNNLELPAIKVGGKQVTPAVGTPNLPLMARGGITKGPSIAGEAGPEAIIPLGRSAQNRADAARVMGQLGMGAGVTQHFHMTNPVEDLPGFMRRAKFEARFAGG